MGVARLACDASRAQRKRFLGQWRDPDWEVLITEPLSMDHTPNPRRVEAGRRNRARRRGLTPEGREKLRELALQHQPWTYSTGPRSPEGKARIALSNRARRKGTQSIASIRAEMAQYAGFIDEMRETRGMLPGLSLPDH